MTNESIGSRLDHHRWPDGSVSSGSPIYNYAQACALYERRRRASRATERVTLERAYDGLGFLVGDSWNSPDVIRATPGNVYPHPGVLEERPVGFRRRAGKGETQ